MPLAIKPADRSAFDLVSLGEVMLRLDPGEGRIRTARHFQAWEGGGEYNVARGLRKCFGMRTALVDLLRGRLPVVPSKTAFCWAHVEDTARGHIQAMEQGKPGETYIITGPRHTFESVFDLAASMASVRPPLLCMKKSFTPGISEATCST